MGWQDAPVVGQGGSPPGGGPLRLTIHYGNTPAADASPAWQKAPVVSDQAPKPGTPEFAASIQAKVDAGQPTPQPATPPPGWVAPDVEPAWARAFSTGAVESVPILGAVAHNSRSPAMQAIDQSAAQQAPAASVAGQVFGSVAPFVAGGEIPGAARFLGMDAAAPLLERTAVAAASNAALAGGDSLIRNNGDIGQAARDAAIGGTVGAVLPGATDLLGRAAGAASRATGRVFDAVTNPQRAAERVVEGAVAQDMRVPGAGMTRADEAGARINNQPVVNADRFGQNVRTLARTAANTDPTAEATLRGAVEQRFLTQSDRAQSFVQRITGGNVNDLALQQQIRDAARTANRANYARAEHSPAAQAMWGAGYQRLMQSPDFIDAIRGATATAANDAAINGTRAVRNPFIVRADGTVNFARQADGSTAIPNLQFWDIVQRNLRAGSEQAFRRGNNQLGSQIAQIRTGLLNQLDTAVPEFARARAGAAAAFGAEDALEAGRNFVGQTKGLPEARRAYAQFSQAERKAFATGFASSLIDKIGAARDRVNVINQVFGSPASRAQVELALGKNAAAELEQFVRVEDIMDMTRNAVSGNSSTAKQLIAAGLVGGGIGGALGGWDPRSVASGAFFLTAGRAGARALGKAVDQRVMQRVADMLTSGNPNALRGVQRMAVANQQAALALQAVERGIQALGMGASVGLTEQPQPHQ